jgi:hypothetical protein
VFPESRETTAEKDNDSSSVKVTADSKKPGRSIDPIFDPIIDQEAIEMCIGDCCYVFGSVEEALAYADAMDSIITVNSQLEATPPDGPFTEVAGKKWRRILVSREGGKSDNSDGLDSSKIQGISIVRKDTVSNRVLVGFRSVDAAYKDWLRTLNGSLTINNGPTSMECFRADYLDGVERIDGLEWNSVSSQPTKPPPKSAETSNGDDSGTKRTSTNGILADGMENNHKDTAYHGGMCNGHQRSESLGKILLPVEQTRPDRAIDGTHAGQILL